MLVEPFILKLKVLELFQSITFSSQSLTFCNEHAWALHCLNVSIYFPRIRNKNPQSRIHWNRLRKQGCAYRYGRGTNGRGK